MDKCNIIRLNNLISYISPTENPLSANVVMIQGKEALWLYDAGNHPDIPQIIEKFRDGRNVNVILSHFHEDHTGSLQDIACNEMYQGKYTYRHTGRGVVVQEDIYIQDGDVSLHIFQLPSSHAKGCIAVEVNEEWCFLGDALYAMQKCGHNLYCSESKSYHATFPLSNSNVATHLFFPAILPSVNLSYLVRVCVVGNSYVLAETEYFSPGLTPRNALIRLIP